MELGKEQIAYYGLINDGNWRFYIAVTDKGLCFVGSQDGEIDEVSHWFKKNRPKAKLVEDEEQIHVYAEQFKEFFRGERKQFNLPLDLKGTAFQELVWSELQHIPFGERISYSDIAERIGKPKAVRAVGSAIGANPIMIVVPCHRVVAKSGKLAGFRGGISMKERLLELESL